jgi:hypothetical protein
MRGIQRKKKYRLSGLKREDDTALQIKRSWGKRPMVSTSTSTHQRAPRAWRKYLVAPRKVSSEMNRKLGMPFSVAEIK